MKNDLDLASLVQPIRNFIRRWHSIIFFVALSALIIAACYTILTIITGQPAVDPNNPDASAVNSSFDTETMKRVEELEPNEISSPPSGRTNPFIE